jgi:hypothetical protein
MPLPYTVNRLEEESRPTPEQEAKDRDRQAKQWQAVRDYVREHPGISHRSALATLQHDRPALFKDSSGLSPEAAEDLKHSNGLKQQRIHAEIERIRKDKPQTFQRAWNQVRQEHPEWFDFQEVTGPSVPLKASSGRVAAAQARAHLAALQEKDFDQDGAPIVREAGEVIVCQGGAFFTDLQTGRVLVQGHRASGSERPHGKRSTRGPSALHE